MFLANYAIGRPTATIVAMIAIVVAGLVALVSLQTDEFPELDPPVVAVTIIYPGAAALTVERELVDPVEERLASISGVDEIRSTATEGLAQIIVLFLFEVDIAVAAQDIRDELSAIRGDLPPEIEEPIIRRFNPEDLPIVSVAVFSDDRTLPELTRIVDPGLTRELRAIPGVAQVNVAGGVDRELSVYVRPDALQAAGIGIGQVLQSLQQQNLEAPAGRVSGELEERTIRLRGRLERPEEFARIVVAEREGRLTRLGDVAEVQDGSEEPRSMALYDGRRAVGIQVVKARGYSTTDVSDRVQERLLALEATLPEDIAVAVVQDRGERVRASVRNVSETLVIGIILAVLVVFVFLQSWRSTVIVANTLPISMLAALAFVWVFGYTLNTMSLLGLTLAIGLLIDDSIVMRENIARHIRQGQDRMTAAREATDEIGLAVVATTLTILAVFVPVAFISGMAGQWLRPFALTVASAVLVSLFVTFTLDPMVSSRWRDPQLEGDRPPRGLLSRALVRVDAWFDRVVERYTGVIDWALNHRLVVMGIAVASFVGALGLQAAFGGAAFAPISDTSEFDVRVDNVPGSSLEYTRLKTEEAAARLRARPEVAYTWSTIGAAAGGGPGTGAGAAVDQANIHVSLVPRRERGVSQQVLEASVREELGRIAGADYLVASGGIGGGQRQVQLQVRGPDADRLTELAEQLAARIREVPGAVDVGLSVRGRRPEIDVELHRSLAASIGLTVADVAQALTPAFAGLDAGEWLDAAGETWPVRVRLDPAARRRPADLERLPLIVTGPDGPAVVPLGQIATVTEALGPAQINRLDRERVIAVEANAEGRALDDLVRDIDRVVAGVPVPGGYQIQHGGEVEAQAEVFGQVFLAIGVGVVLMYLILVVLFDSFLAPMTILASLPLALIGVVIALILTGDTLNIMSLIGVVLLGGIVTKESILLIDFARRHEREGANRHDALREAGRIRLRPILMTTAALVAGMLPVAIGIGEGADFRAPLGRAVVGGTIASAVLTLLVIPTFYDIVESAREWLLARLRGGRRDAHAR